MRFCEASSQYPVGASQEMWSLCVLSVSLLLGSVSCVPDSDNAAGIPLDVPPEIVKELALLAGNEASVMKSSGTMIQCALTRNAPLTSRKGPLYFIMDRIAKDSKLATALWKTMSKRFHKQTGITANINDYLDKVFFNIQKLLIRQGYDPMQLPDQHQGFSKKIIFITYHGEFDLTRGWLQDAATIKRMGDALISFEPSTKKLLIEMPIGFDDLMFTYKYSLKFMNLGPVGGVDGKISKVKINTAIEIDLNTFSAKVQKFTAVNSGHIDVEFTGHIFTDWILDMMSEMTTTLMHNVIFGIVSGVVKSGLDIAVNDINQLLNEILNPPAPVPPTEAPTALYAPFNYYRNYGN